jgi:uncharacterized protein (TIGR00251 family)
MHVRIRVKPNARADVVTAWDPITRVADISLRAPPVDGKANAALERFLAELLGCAPTRVSVTHGATSRTKRVEVPDEAEFDRIGRWVGTQPRR